MPTLYSALRPLLFRASPEGAHHLSIRAGKLGQRAPGVLRAVFRSGLSREQAARLSVRALGLEFANPIGVAAGLDKNAELIPMWAAVGLGFCEVGSISALPSAGNPKPRAFRLPEDRALVNRMGLNNHGLDAIARRIERTRRPAGFPLAINIVKTHDPSILGDAGIQDFAASARRLLPLADLLVLNVSCPNTTEGKTFEDPEALEPLLDAVMRVRAELASTVPVLVKLSPPATVDFDSAAVDELVDLSLERGIAGFVATNTASDRAGLRTSPGRLDAIGRGGPERRPAGVPRGGSRPAPRPPRRRPRRDHRGRRDRLTRGGLSANPGRRQPRGALHGPRVRGARPDSADRTAPGGTPRRGRSRAPGGCGGARSVSEAGSNRRRREPT